MSAHDPLASGNKPYVRLWSLLEIMRQFHAFYFMAVRSVMRHHQSMSTKSVTLNALIAGKAKLDKLFGKAGEEQEEQEPEIWTANGVINPSDRVDFFEMYQELKGNCRDLEMASSIATVNRVLHCLADRKSTYGDLWKFAPELDSRIFDEIEQRTFFALSSREAAYYQFPMRGWEEIIERIPATLADIEEASKCFALCRYAAAVFHSLQVVEVGLIELGKSIGVTDPKSGWTATTNRLAGIIKKGHEARTSFEREHFEFFEQIQGTIEGLKNAWRNKVSHAQGRLALMTSDFTPDIAEEILFATRAFMRRLVTETPRVPDPGA